MPIRHIKICVKSFLLTNGYTAVFPTTFLLAGEIVVCLATREMTAVFLSIMPNKLRL